MSAICPACPHPLRLHPENLDGACNVCECTGTAASPAPTPAPRPPASERTKVCTGCHVEKPITEFYRHNDRGTKVCPRCRDCDNARPRTRSANRVLRVRARHRAVAALVERHAAEFRELLEYYVKIVDQEARQLAVAAADTFETNGHGHTPSMPRIKRGPRRKGQELVERLDVARCPQCVGYHDRGHRCAECGAEPQAVPA
jgi:hypothetical protein